MMTMLSISHAKQSNGQQNQNNIYFHCFKYNRLLRFGTQILTDQINADLVRFYTQPKIDIGADLEFDWLMDRIAQVDRMRKCDKRRKANKTNL